MSTLKVDTLNTRTGSGNITFSRPTILTAGDIVTADIADDAVTTAKILLANVTTAKIADNAITLLKMAGGTDGQIITYDASGDPIAVGPGTAAQVLTSAGAGAPPTFSTISAGATFSVKRASRNMTTASGNQDITGMGFQPTAAIVFCSADNAHRMVSIGYKDFVGGGTGVIYSENDNTSGQWRFYYIPTAQMEQSTSGYRQVASCTALADGVRLSWVKSGSTASVAYTSYVMGMK